MMTTHRLLVCAALSTLVACSGGGDPFTDADPRCAAICAIDEPAVSGAGDICSLDSAELCIDTCAVRIAGVDTLCASCLLEDAYFGTDDVVLPGDYCDGQTCTMTGRAGTCTYPYGNETARQACMRQVSPRREVTCEADFRPVTECSSVCVASGSGSGM